jgi:hypothetical protein
MECVRRIYKQFTNLFEPKRKKCDCGDPDCQTYISVEGEGTLVRHNILTCGHVKKQILDMQRILDMKK